MLPTLNKVNLVSSLCVLFSKDNTRFNCNKFINACDQIATYTTNEDATLLVAFLFPFEVKNTNPNNNYNVFQIAI